MGALGTGAAVLRGVQTFPPNVLPAVPFWNLEMQTLLDLLGSLGKQQPGQGCPVCAGWTSGLGGQALQVVWRESSTDSENKLEKLFLQHAVPTPFPSQFTKPSMGRCLEAETKSLDHR